MAVDVAATAAQLGHTGLIVVQDMFLNGFSRTFAGSGYRRINPFQVQAGTAPSSFVAPHSLGDWEGYDHDSVPAGSGLAIVMGYAGFTLSWTNPAGYSLAPSILDCMIYVRSMGASEDLSVDPFTSPDKTQSGGDDATEFVTAASFVGEFVAIGVKARFDDSVAVHEGAVGFAPAGGQTPLIGAGIGISSGQAIWAPAPTIDSVDQVTDPGTCSIPDVVELSIDVSMQGPSTGTLQESVDMGAFVTVDSGVPAGSTSLTRNVPSGSNYRYRLRYNSVSPDTWSNILGRDAECTLV